MQKLFNVKWLFCGALALAPFASLAAADPNLKEQENILGRRDLQQIVQKQELDSYWLDQRMWYEYGYRPHVDMQRVHWPTKLPKSLKPYYYGPSWKIKDKLDLGDPKAKFAIQWGKHGTWH